MKSAVSLTILVLLVTFYLPPTSSFISGFDKIFKKFAYQKIFDACLGLETASLWRKQVNDAKAACTYNVEHIMRPIMARYATMAELEPLYEPSINGDGPEVVQFNRRKVIQLELATLRRTEMIKCTLEELGVIDAETQSLNVFVMATRYDSLVHLDRTLKDEIKEGIIICGAASGMLLPHVDHTGLTLPLKKALMFASCERKRRTLACMRHDMFTRADKYDLRGVDDMTVKGILLPLSPGIRESIMRLFWTDSYQSDHYHHFTIP